MGNAGLKVVIFAALPRGHFVVLSLLPPGAHLLWVTTQHLRPTYSQLNKNSGWWGWFACVLHCFGCGLGKRRGSVLDYNLNQETSFFFFFLQTMLNTGKTCKFGSWCLLVKYLTVKDKMGVEMDCSVDSDLPPFCWAQRKFASWLLKLICLRDIRSPGPSDCLFTWNCPFNPFSCHDICNHTMCPLISWVHTCVCM